MSNREIILLIKIALAITYIILLCNFPFTTIIISIILYALYCSIISSDDRKDRWVDGYYKKDGTEYVEGHWRRKK